MQTILLLTLSLSLLGAVVTQKPHRCKSPPYLEGKVVVIFPQGHTLVYEKFYYDALEERIRVFVSGTNGTQRMHADILMLYRERVYYTISYHNKTCTKAPLITAFSPVAIPADAHHVAQVVLGTLSAPGQGLLVNNWVGSIPEMKANYSMTFTEFGCIPVTTISSVQGTGQFISSFFDMVLGLSDPDIFIPPSFCDSAKLEDEDKVDFFAALLKNLSV